MSRHHTVWCDCPDHPAGGESPWLVLAGVVAIALVVLGVYGFVAVLHLLIGASW